VISSDCLQTANHHVSPTYLHPFNSLFSRITWVSRHQKGRTF